MVSIHIVAEEIIEVCLWPLTSKHVQTAVSLWLLGKRNKKKQKWRNTEIMINIKALRSLLKQPSNYNKPKTCFQKGKWDSQCGRACSVQCETGHLPAQRYTSLPSRGSTFRPGSGRHTSRWTEALMFDCPPRCRYMSGCARQKCRSCASLSPCTSAGRGEDKEDKRWGNRKCKSSEREVASTAGWVSDFHYMWSRN